MEDLADDLPDSSPRFIILSHPLTLVSCEKKRICTPAMENWKCRVSRLTVCCCNFYSHLVDYLSHTLCYIGFRRTAIRRKGWHTLVQLSSWGIRQRSIVWLRFRPMKMLLILRRSWPRSRYGCAALLYIHRIYWIWYLLGLVVVMGLRVCLGGMSQLFGASLFIIQPDYPQQLQHSVCHVIECK